MELSLKELDGFAQGTCPCVLIIMHSVASFNLIQALVAQHFHEGQSLHTLHQHIKHMSPALSGNSLLCALNSAIEVYDELFFNFCSGLPATYILDMTSCRHTV